MIASPAELLYPTAAECRRIGLYMPPMIADMERAVGAQTTRAFLIQHGGKDLLIPVKVKPGHAHNAALTWLLKTYGAGRLSIPFGPASRTARMRWTAYRHFEAGRSVRVIAQALDTTERSVTRHRRRLVEAGALAPRPFQTSEETDP
ncbi:helix-turn-helix domain-containing protein [Dinoroseobacter shibae]|jgi:hypothetical protein|nr:helix-turn-helix domain-containing protein [Dinoroseobacter shibae]URF46822.1 helix-turn-helix domain-containing protein [Dinoroseobacter shibae]URF51133.1 helix-turn-helix domain-containing protein [Dinoroseobacter shibae]